MANPNCRPVTVAGIKTDREHRSPDLIVCSQLHLVLWPTDTNEGTNAGPKEDQGTAASDTHICRVFGPLTTYCSGLIPWRIVGQPAYEARPVIRLRPSIRP